MTEIKTVDRLKLTVGPFTYVVNLGNYQRLEIPITKEFWADEITVKDALKQIDGEILAWMDERGIKPTIVASSVPRK